MPPRRLRFNDWHLEWKSVHGFPMYEISNMGEVRNVVTGCVLGKGRTQFGNEYYTLYKDGVRYVKGLQKLLKKHFGEAEF